MMAPKLKHPLELADSALGRRADLAMTDTNREASGGARRLVVRDLRFAGTVAAGLVAGVLGVGALSAPLLGWSEWSDTLQPGGGENNAVTMVAPSEREATIESNGSGSAGAGAENVTSLVAATGTSIIGAGSAVTTGSVIVPGGTGGGGAGGTDGTGGAGGTGEAD